MLLKINIKIPELYINSMLFFSIISFILYFKNIYELAILGGNSQGIGKMLIYARHTILSNLGRISYYLSIALFIIKSFILILTYEMIKSNIVEKKILYIKRKFFMICIYIGIMVLSTGRTEFIYYIVYILNVYSVLYFQKHNWNIKINYKILKLGVLSFTTFLIIFSLAGYLTNKTQQKKIFEMISIYVGSSIPALELFLEKFDRPSNYFGSHTLAIIYKLLKKINFDVPQLYGPCEIVWFNEKVATNVYTALKRYIEDYNIIGLFVIMFILGYLYTLLFKKCCYKKNNDFKLIIYSVLCYPLYEISIEERTLTTIFTTGTIYIFVFTYYFYKKFKIRGIINERNNISGRKWNKTLSNNKSNIKTDKSNI